MVADLESIEPTPEVIVEDDRTGMHPATLERAVLDHLYYTCSKDERTATPLDVLRAVSHAARDRLVHRWIKTQRTYHERDVKRVYYLSAEYLLGRSLTVREYADQIWEVEPMEIILETEDLKAGQGDASSSG